MKDDNPQIARERKHFERFIEIKWKSCGTAMIRLRIGDSYEEPLGSLWDVWTESAKIPRSGFETLIANALSLD